MPYASGTCRGCGAEPEPGKTRCKYCAASRATEEAARRDARRAAGQCLVCGKRAKKDRRYCVDHLAYYAARAAAR